MKAIHNALTLGCNFEIVVLYLKDTQKWKQFTTGKEQHAMAKMLCYISKILKNESNSQQRTRRRVRRISCVISQRYSKMKAIHNDDLASTVDNRVVLYLKDTQKWKQFTTIHPKCPKIIMLCYISKILKNESNSQQLNYVGIMAQCCVISQRYSKMKAIHNSMLMISISFEVVLYLKDTQKWKQFTTDITANVENIRLCYISKILKNESNSQLAYR